MYLTDLPEIFTWQAQNAVLTQLHQQYVELLLERLGQLIGRLRLAGHDELADGALTRVGQLPDQELAALLCEPEVSYRLLWPTHHRDVDSGLFVQSTLSDRGAALTARRLRVIGLPTDVGSEFALTVDVTGTKSRLSEPRPALPSDALVSTLSRLEVAASQISAGVPAAWRIVEDFTKVLILLPDLDAPMQLSSGSSGQFVGRTVIANPHLGKVTPVELAEALVHESIHSVLYMDEQLDAWVLDDSLYAGPERVTSPWTGNPLPLRPYLQACFVWYGLLSFWSEAMCRCTFDGEKAKERFSIAVAGFLRGDLLGRVDGVSNRLSGELRAAVAELQSRVRECMTPRGAK